MSQIIIVSNRLPISVKKSGGKLEFTPSVGGLATGLSSYANDKMSTWIGWPGIASDELTAQDREQIVEELAKHNCSPVFLTRKQIEDFYNGYSNTVLWPLFHKMKPQDNPGKRRDRWYRAYRDVNKRFAEAVEMAVQNNARIWVHDYQLLLVPNMLRHLTLDATIGFFLHIPFPDPKKFCSLPRHRLMLRGMLGADLIGFHTPDYVDNFLKTCEKCSLGSVGDQALVYKDRVIRVSDFPMGIDYEKYASAGKSKDVKEIAKSYQRRYRGKKIIVAVDRLDPSKGLPERLISYRELLKRHPKLIGKLVFIMVAAPSRTDVPAYRRLAKRIDKLVSEINGTYGTSKWQPIEYINRVVPFEEVSAIFHVADVAFIAPLRDGMNLAAKEFVASVKKHGVLILSETAGAAQELSDALIVNPSKPETVIRGLYESLTMRRPELTGRLKRMKRHLKDNTVHTWAKNFITTLSKPVPGTTIRTRSLDRKSLSHLYDDFENSRKRLLLLDYDGSLVPFRKNHGDAKPPKSLLNMLRKLAESPKNDVVLISGRSDENLDSWFGHLPLNLVAEHGASIKKVNNTKWHSNRHQDNTWKKQLLPVCEKIAARAPGARVEIKTHSLVWHYRGMTPYHAQKYTVMLRRALKPFLKQYGLEVMKGNKVLEVKNPNFTKGAAAETWLARKYDFVLGIGDDTTDEDLFKAMDGTGYSVKVGRGRTAARFRAANHKLINQLLRNLSNR